MALRRPSPTSPFSELTLERLADFAESRAGKVYRDVCERFGVDPGRPLDDDFMAYQLRLALALAHPSEDVAEEEEQSDGAATLRESQRKVAELRAELGGVP